MLNEKIKKLRLSYRLAQVELAKELGVSKQCVSNWENDNIQPSIEMLKKLAGVFSVSTDYLLGLEAGACLDVSGLPALFVTHLRQVIEDFRTLQS